MILYIDSADSQKTFIALEDKGKRIELEAVNNYRTSQVLLPLIEKLLHQENVSFDDLDEIRVNSGPGSYTGVRVGVAVANALGFLLGIPVVC